MQSSKKIKQGQVDSQNAFSFELPIFVYSRYTSTNFSGLGATVGYPQFNFDMGVSNRFLIVPSADTVVYRVPRNCTLDKLVLYGNSATHEIAIYKTPNASGVSASLVYHNAVTGGMNDSNIGISIEDGYFLHLFFRNSLGTNGSNNARLFLTFK